MDREIAEFGRRLGLGPLVLPERGSLALEIESAGRLYLEAGEGELRLYLALPLPPYDRETLPRALTRAGFESAPAFPLSCGLAGDSLLLLTRLASARVTAGELERAAEFLLREMAALGRND